MRSSDLYGIVNGIDTDIWNPETDKHLVSAYSAQTLKARLPNRAVVEDRFNLEHDDSPIVCVISRLTWQKGMLLADSGDGRLAVIVNGDRRQCVFTLPERAGFRWHELLVIARVVGDVHRPIERLTGQDRRYTPIGGLHPHGR